MDTLRALGVYREFLRLTCRVGFTPQFWAIEGNSYSEKVKNFFPLSNSKPTRKWPTVYQVPAATQQSTASISTLSAVGSGFAITHRQTSSVSVRGSPKMTSGTKSQAREFHTAGSIEPVPSPIPPSASSSACLACTIFARGETINRANTEDLMMIDNMLRPDSELQYPDLMLIMVRHWLRHSAQHADRGRHHHRGICHFHW